MPNTHKKLHPATREACERISQHLQERRANRTRTRLFAQPRDPGIRQARNQQEVQP
jgi:hypothetical protein